MAASSQLVGLTLGHYRILEQIGKGGMGIVYRAHDLRLERDVALKALPPGTLADEGARKRFRKEALILSKLSHPNIAMVFDFDSQKGTDFLITEYIPGTTLDARLGPEFLPEKEVVRLGLQLAEGLAAAHERGVVHRDLKPSNLRITPDGRLKILDFGIAQLLPGGEQALTQTLTKEQGIIGTLPYMAPEQLQGNSVDVRTDIYGAGVVLYEMATGTRPFEAKLSTGLATDIIHKPPIPPGRVNPKLSPKLEDIILKCLEKDPDNRYQSAKELAVDLRRLTVSTSSTPVTVPVRVGKKWVWAFAIIGAAALATLILMFSWNVGGLRERLLGTQSQTIRSIAVLPLENLSRDPDQEYFADGMTEELITELSKIAALRVISRTSIMQYKGTKKTIPQIARELSVDGVIEGSVMRSGDRVRITAQLIQGENDKHLWAESYERDLRDIFGLQSEVAEAISNEISVKLTPQEHSRLTPVHAVNPDAYEAYLRGLSSFHQGRDLLPTNRGKELMQDAIRYFEQASKDDPSYAMPYVGLARTYHWLASTVGPEELYSDSKVAALKALEIDDSAAEAHAALGFVFYNHDWDWAAAERAFRRAIELNSNGDVHHGYALYLASMGRTGEAVREIDEAQKLDPLTLPLKANAALIYLCAHQYDRAVAEIRGLVEIVPNDIDAHVLLGIAYLQEGRNDEGLIEIQKAARLSKSPLRWLGWAYAKMGRKADAVDVINKMRSRLHKDSEVPFDIATIYAALGTKDMAFQWLQTAYERRSPGIVDIKCETAFDPFRSDPRYADLLRRMGLPQ